MQNRRNKYCVPLGDVSAIETYISDWGEECPNCRPEVIRQFYNPDDGDYIEDEGFRPYEGSGGTNTNDIDWLLRHI